MNELKHYGTKGQKWGIRKYQNPDGSYTELGKERRRVGHDDASEQSPKVEIGKSKTYGKLGFFKRMKLKRQLKEARKKAEDKKRAITQGDIAWASENINDLTDQEINDLVNRRWTMEKVYKFQREDEERASRALQEFANRWERRLSRTASMTKSMADIKHNLDRLSGNNKDPKDKDKHAGDKVKDAKFVKNKKKASKEKPARNEDSQNDQNDSTEEPSGLKTKKQWLMEAASKVDTPSNPKRKLRNESREKSEPEYKVKVTPEKREASASAWDKYVDNRWGDDIYEVSFDGKRKKKKK